MLRQWICNFSMFQPGPWKYLPKNMYIRKIWEERNSQGIDQKSVMRNSPNQYKLAVLHWILTHDKCLVRQKQEYQSSNCQNITEQNFLNITHVESKFVYLSICNKLHCQLNRIQTHWFWLTLSSAQGVCWTSLRRETGNFWSCLSWWIWLHR